MRGLLRGGLLVASVGLALHLILPQIPGLERSARLLAGTSHVLVAAALVAELPTRGCAGLSTADTFPSGISRRRRLARSSPVPTAPRRSSSVTRLPPVIMVYLHALPMSFGTESGVGDARVD